LYKKYKILFKKGKRIMLNVVSNGHNYAVGFKHTKQLVGIYSQSEGAERDVTYATLYEIGEIREGEKHPDREVKASSFMIVNPTKSASKYTRRKEALGKLLRENVSDKAGRMDFWEAFRREWGLY
jgi:hypothetical protein